MEMASSPADRDITEVSFRTATLTDASEIAEILNEAARWMATKGIRQWPVNGFSADDVCKSMTDGEWILAEVDGRVVGVMIVYFEPQPFDETIWGSLARDGRAVYLHRLAVRRSCAGQGLGQALLHHAITLAGEAHKPLLRLDCRAHNQALNQYYLSLGFRYCGEQPGVHAGSADRYSLYEIVTAEVNGEHE